MPDVAVIPQDPNVALEEFKSVVAERRFVMTSYMQAIAFYIALVGFVGGQYFAVRTKPEHLFLLAFMLVVNTLAWLGARKFRALADHAIDREAALARDLRVQPPYPLVWGYLYALAMGALIELGVLAELIRQLR